MKKLRMIKRNLKFFFPLIFKAYPIIIVFVIIGALLNSLSSFLWLVYPAKIVEELMGNRSIELLIKIVCILVFGNFIISIVNNLLSVAGDYYARKADFKIDKMVNDKIMEVDYFQLESPDFKDLVSRAKKGMSEYSSGIYSIIYNIKSLISDTVTIAGVIGIVIYSKEYIAILVSLIGIVFYWFFNNTYRNLDKSFNDNFVRFWRKLNYYNRNIFSFQSQKELRMYDCKKMIQDTCNIENEKAFVEYRKQVNRKQRLTFFESFIYVFFTRMLSILILAWSCYRGNITLATFTLLFQSMQTLSSRCDMLVYTLKMYSQECEYQNDFIDLIEFKSVFKEGKEKIDKLETIEFKNVSFKYPGCDNYVLENLSFKLDNKEKTSLVGLNGSGKTTLIKLLCRFFKVNEGEILINGKNIEEYDYDSYMKKLAIVFQDFSIISFSIKSNIANCDNDQEKLYDCLKRAQALDLVMGLEKKENTYINKWFDKTGIEFSGGEKQKFAIARCLYKDGDFVVLDEPTSALDPMAESEIYYHFNEIVGKKLTLFISHRLSSCIFSDRILVLDGARIVEEGTHKELMKKEDGLYHKMFTAQAEYYK